MGENKVTLLIADDEVTIRNGLSNAVNWEELNIQVVAIAKDGKEALDLIVSISPDIVITDIRMPIYSGLEVIEKTRALGIDTEFIILSGYEEFSYAKRAINSRVCEYLLKPINREALYNCINSILRRFKSADVQKKVDSFENEFLQRRSLQLVNEQFYSKLAAKEFNSETKAINAINSLGCSELLFPTKAVKVMFTLPDTIELAYFSNQDSQLFKVAMRNVIEEILDDEFVVFFSDTYNSLGMILKQCVCTNYFLSEFISTIEKMSPLKLTLGVGNSANTYMQVAQSCIKAQEMVEYHMYEAEVKIFDAEFISDIVNEPKENTPSSENLAAAIIEGNTALIEKYLEEYMSSIFYTCFPPPRYLRGMCVLCVMDTYKKIEDLMHCKLPSSFQDWIKEIENFITFSGVKNYMLSELIALSDSIRSKSQNNVIPVVKQAQEFIIANTLSKILVEDVAAHVHLSESHFALIFKKHTGMTVRDYIVNCKLNKAKELLLTRTHTILEISEMLEYSDYRSFSRAFKKNFGYSPTDFQNIVYSTKEKIENE